MPSRSLMSNGRDSRTCVKWFVKRAGKRNGRLFTSFFSLEIQLSPVIVSLGIVARPKEC